MCRNRKCEPQVHSAGIPLQWGVKKLLHSREFNYLVKFGCNLRSTHTEDRSAQKDVFPACQLGMKSGADLKKRPKSPADLSTSGCGRHNSSKYLEEGALASTVRANNAHNLARPNFERDIAQRPKLPVLISL